MVSTIDQASMTFVNRYMDFYSKKMSVLKVSIVVLALLSAVSLLVLVGQFYPNLIGFSLAVSFPKTLMISALVSIVAVALLMMCATYYVIKEKNLKKELFRNLGLLDLKKNEKIDSIVQAVSLVGIERKSSGLDKDPAQNNPSCQNELEELKKRLENYDFYKAQHDVLKEDSTRQKVLIESYLRQIETLTTELTSLKKSKSTSKEEISIV